MPAKISTPPFRTLESAVERFFRRQAPVAAGDGVLVAFSGGPDSLALLAALAALAPRRRLRLHAAHLDHGLDAGSRQRAQQAAQLAEQLQVPLLRHRRPVAEERRRGESPEEAARRVRYGFLAQARRRLGCRYVATGHHLDDQAETVLLRLLYGSGVEGLAAMSPRRGWLVRPLLGLSRSQLSAALADGATAGGAPLTPTADPTNADPAMMRNRIRHALLPRLAGDDDALPRRLAALAEGAAGAAARIEGELAARLEPAAVDGGAALRYAAFIALPAPLQRHALALLHRRAGAPYPPPGRAVDELLRQLHHGAGVGCDCGAGWRWERCGDRLVALAPEAPSPTDPAPTRGFSYTLGRQSHCSEEAGIRDSRFRLPRVRGRAE